LPNWRRSGAGGPDFDEVSQDGTRKWVMRMAEGNSIEAVLIPDGERGTLCVSSQVGCSLDCSFCSTGKQGFNRNLSSAEIIGQLWAALRTFMPFDRTQGTPRDQCGHDGHGRASVKL